MKERMTRRKFIKVSALTAATVAGSGLWACGKKAGDAEHGAVFDADVYSTAGKGRIVPEQVIGKVPGYTGKRPNIVTILCDDLGWGDLGCYGNRVIRTPNIDGLARQGVRFTDFYSSCSVCTPSRYGLLTGRYAVRSGLIFVMPASGESMMQFTIRRLGRWFGSAGAVDVQEDCWVEGLPEDEITLAGALKVAGYRTGMVGKWHLGDFSRKPQYNPRRYGFDSFFGVPHSNDMPPCALYRDETMLEPDIKQNQARLTGMYTKEAINFIDKSKDGPFFLYLAHTFPHQPLYASERFKDKSKVGIYGDVVEEIDWSVGEIMKCLERNGVADDTIVVLTSDNGPWYNGSPGGFRGRKGQSYEGGYRVPFIVKWPRGMRGGAVCAEPAMNLDLFPTMTAAAGLALPSDRIIDGKNIAGLITGKETESPHDALYFYHYEELEGMRQGNWKYFRNINHYTWPQPVDKPTTFMGGVAAKGHFASWPNLYSLDVDEGECYNQAARYPDVSRRMASAMEKWERELAANPRGWVKK
jgi:arylsulfatase A